LGFAVSADGTLALVTDMIRGEVAVVDVATRAIEAKKIPTGDSPTSIVVSSDGLLAMTANAGPDDPSVKGHPAGSVTIIDIARRISSTLALDKSVKAVGITPDGTSALVALLAPRDDEDGEDDVIVF
jgi:YVTN family beta-propeller protein